MLATNLNIVSHSHPLWTLLVLPVGAVSLLAMLSLLVLPLVQLVLLSGMPSCLMLKCYVSCDVH